MIRPNRSVLAVGGVILAGSLITALNPRTVRAVEVAAATVKATLVQVTNTASNPVVNSEVSRMATQTVSVCIGQTATGTRTPFEEVIPGGGMEGEEYVVPAGGSLVITEIDIQSRASGFFRLSPVTTGSGGNIEQFFEMPGDEVTHQFLFPNGIVWPSGQNIPYSADTGIGQVCMRGYLTRS